MLALDAAIVHLLISADGHEGEVQAIKMVFQIEHTRKAGACEFSFGPEQLSVALLNSLWRIGYNHMKAFSKIFMIKVSS